MRIVAVALVALLGCGGAPAPGDAGSDSGYDAGRDAGWPESGVTPTDCTPGDGPCCSGSGYFMLAGTPCGAGPLGSVSCVELPSQDWTEGTVRVLECSGTSSACTSEGPFVDVTFVCEFGCSSAMPDCTSNGITGCYAPGEFASVVCRGADYLGE